MKKFVLFALIIALILPVISDAKKRKKYQVVEVANGGSIKGTIRASENVPDPVIKIVTEKAEEYDYCGKEFKANKYMISPDLGIKNVIVAVKDVKKGKAMPGDDTVINNYKCQFEPLVGIAFKGAQFVLKNSDPLFHNTSLGLQRKNKRSTVYNIALPNKGQVIRKPVRRTGLNLIKCDSHPWMRAYVYASKNPYAVVTDESGRFEIKDLLPGTYEVLIWHEGFGWITKTVEVKGGQTTALNHTFSKK